MYAEKPLPHSFEAEESIIDALLIDGDSLVRVAAVIKPDDFYREKNRLCFAACVSLFQRNEAIDQVTVARELGRDGHLKGRPPEGAHAGVPGCQGRAVPNPVGLGFGSDLQGRRGSHPGDHRAPWALRRQGAFLQKSWTEVERPMQELLLSFVAWVARTESNRWSERTKAGLARAVAEEKHLDRPAGSKDKKKRSR